MTAAVTPLPDLSTPFSDRVASETAAGLTPAPTPEPVPEAVADATPEVAAEAVESTEPAAEGAEAVAEPAPTTFKVQIPLPNGTGENGPTNAGLLDIDFPTQEAADTIRFHVKQSQQVPRLRERLAGLRTDQATVDFLTDHPAEGMMWMAQTNPDAAAEFLGTFIRANASSAAQTLADLGYQVSVPQGLDRTLKLESDLAQRDARDKVAQGQAQFQAAQKLTEFRESAQEVVHDLITAAGIAKEGEDYAVFATRASARLADLYKAKQGNVTTTDMLTTLQPLVAALVKPASATTPTPIERPRNPDGTFKPTVSEQRTATLRKIAGPGGTSSVAAVTKLPPSASLYDLRKATQGR